MAAPVPSTVSMQESDRIRARQQVEGLLAASPSSPASTTPLEAAAPGNTDYTLHEESRSPALNQRASPRPLGQPLRPTISAPTSAPRTTSSAGVFGGGDARNFASPVAQRISPLLPGEVKEKESCTQSATKSLVYGLINAVVLVPVMVGFAQIIFQDQFFAPHRPVLVKLVLFSAIVHQSVFTFSSTLPFAIGQVQDAGLIFLSSIASSVVELTKDELSEEDVLSTTLFTLAIATTLLGVALWITGKCKLASLVQYLPMPVVGGYLAFIGLYCGEAGLSLMTGLEIQGVKDWPGIFHKEPLRLALPGFVIGILMYLIVRRFRHFAVLPTMLLVIPILFYIVLFASGSNIEEAREQKWLDSDTSSIDFWNIWKLFKPSGFAFRVLPHQFVPWFTMYCVVAFSSCLDVAAIQVDLGRALDFNHELKTVGISNIISGITGGFTGSYIFSQTIFTMRVGVRDRKVGCIIIICEILIFMLPFSILAFVPAMFFGGILTFIAVDLLIDWLVESRHKFGWKEYCIVWVTFIAILLTDLETGMIVGTVVTALTFVVRYALSGAQVRAIAPRSLILRNITHREILNQNASKIRALRISGHIFFGSAVRLLRDVTNTIPRWEERDSDNSSLSRGGSLSQSMNTITMSGIEADVALASSLISQAESAYDAGPPPPAYVILDLSQVTGLDATSCTTCFQPLVRIAQEQNAVLVIAGATGEVLDLLRRQAVLPKPDAVPIQEEETSSSVKSFESFEESVEWCENEVIKSAEARIPIAQRRGRGRLNSMESALSEATGLAEVNVAVEQYFGNVEKKMGEVIFHVGAAANEMYVVNSGVVELQNTDGTRILRCFRGAFVGDMDFVLERKRSFTAVALEDTQLWCLTRSENRRMLDEEPKIGSSLQVALCRGLALSVREVLIDRDALVETDAVMGS